MDQNPERPIITFFLMVVWFFYSIDNARLS